MLTIQQYLVKLQNLLVIELVTFGYKSKQRNELLIRCGSTYGGWWIPKRILENTDTNRLLISAGLGFDVTFDEALLKAGFEVIGLDPLSDSVNYAVEKLGQYPKFTGLNRGLWTQPGKALFFAPRNESHDSWSATNLQKTSIADAREFSVVTLDELIQKYPQVSANDYLVLKLDIEGSEEFLLSAIASHKHRFDFIAIEMDFLSIIPFLFFWQRLRSIVKARTELKNFKNEGYTFLMNEHFNFFWIRE